MSDDEQDNIARLKKLRENPLFSPEYTAGTPEYKAKHVLIFLDSAIRMLQPPDLFGGAKTNANEWLVLHSPTSRDTFAEIHIFIQDNPNHPKVEEIKNKNNEVKKLIRIRFNNPDAHKGFVKDIETAIKRLMAKVSNDKYTTKTIPDDRWFAHSNKDNVTLSYAVSNFRNIDLSCQRLGIQILYDPFDQTYRIEWDGEVIIVSTSRQVRSRLLVPISSNHGYEMHRDHFDDFIETIKSDKSRHYDSLIQYYDSFEAHYDSDFKCIDEMVDVCNTEDDDYTREGLRSFLIGHIQRAYFPGCELQRIISLIGDENIGKSSLIKMKAGNLDWNVKGGIKAIRWYSNKPILNPQMSDRDRHSACIAINMFENDERRGLRAIDAEHFRSFVTSLMMISVYGWVWSQCVYCAVGIW